MLKRANYESIEKTLNFTLNSIVLASDKDLDERQQAISEVIYYRDLIRTIYEYDKDDREVIENDSLEIAEEMLKWIKS